MAVGKSNQNNPFQLTSSLIRKSLLKMDVRCTLHCRVCYPHQCLTPTTRYNGEMLQICNMPFKSQMSNWHG